MHAEALLDTKSYMCISKYGNIFGSASNGDKVGDVVILACLLFH